MNFVSFYPPAIGGLIVRRRKFSFVALALKESLLKDKTKIETPMTLTLGITKVSKLAIRPCWTPNLEYELFCSEDATIPGHSTGVVKTGLIVHVPEGTHVRIIPDSGPIVNKHNGEDLDVIVYNQHAKDEVFTYGQRIARIILVAHAHVEVVEEQPDETHWVARITDFYANQIIIMSQTQQIFYVCSQASDYRLYDVGDMWNALERLAKKVLETEYGTDKTRCLAIGCRELQGSTAIIIDINIRSHKSLTHLREMPLYYVDVDTKQCISAEKALAIAEDDAHARLM